MDKVDMGYLRVVATKRGFLKDCVVTDISFTSLDVPVGLHNIDNEQCYLVKKDDLDALEARNETLEEMNCTPVWDENQKLKDRIKELEDQLTDQKKKYDKKLCEAFMETNTALHNGVYRLIAIDKEIEDLKKQAEQIEELEKDRDYWKDRYAKANNELFQKDLAYVALEEAYKKEKAAGEVLLKDRDIAYITGVEKSCESLKEERDAWKRRFDKADKMVADLKKENQTLTDRNSELDKELDRIRNLSIDSISKALLPFGVHVGLVNPKGPGTFELDVDIPELTEAKKKIKRLEDALILAKDRGDYWCREHGVKTREYQKLERKHDTKWSAMLQALKEKGVEVLYMGEEDGKPNIDVKIPAIGDLKKELDDLKSKTVAEVRCEWHSDCFTAIYTKCNGTKEVVGMDSAGDTDEKSTMGAFVCRTFNIPQCKNCMNHRYFTNGGHYCNLPDSKHTIPGMFLINSLTEEEAEGPACEKFEARRK